ncbi:MAG: hypothetical protein Q8916_09175 [Bacteroidota bacterium]|nr:hypothetical protein [Bacteroidota bacterium]MDP4230558.1 hypothetical protein [Bacteroidota bacterium]MDP4236685.1 hypothetical protein [Bacteroidota bacterium]
MITIPVHLRLIIVWSAIIIIGHPRPVRADAVPHFGQPHVVVRIACKMSKPCTLSSVWLLVRQEGTPVFDTPKVEPYRGHFLQIDHDRPDLNEYMIRGRGMALGDFRLAIVIGSDTMRTPILHALYPSASIDLEVTDSGVVDTSSVFQMDWSTYLYFLLVTIISESLVALLFFWRANIPFGKIWVIITMNLISHPALWTICTFIAGFGIGKIVVEIGVVFFEAWWIYRFLGEYYTFSKSLKRSFVLNFISYFLGGLISLFIGLG